MQAHQEPDPGTDRPLALVTGASSGIGLARQFVEHDFDVIINAEDDELAAAEPGWQRRQRPVGHCRPVEL